MRLRWIMSITAILFVLVLIGSVTDYAARERSVPVASWPRVKECPPYPPAKTGQAECFDTFGNQIACAGTGQDGEYRNGSAVNPRYRNNFDGTVKDNLTGLLWLQDADCFGQQDWATALSDASALADGSCGLTDGSMPGDWRMPNVLELLSLIDHGNENPALPWPHPFLISPDGGYGPSHSYWTSSTRYLGPVCTLFAYRVQMFWGVPALVDAHPSSYEDGRVWPVRGPE